MTTSDRVVEVLVVEGGYRELPKPLLIGRLKFDFPHALVASNKANDLVIVIEPKGDAADEALVRKVLSLTRALDVLHSRRSVTAVLTSGQAAPDTVQSISRVCRVLPIGAPSGPKAMDSIRDWLSVLLPLSEPPAIESFINWEGDLRALLPEKSASSLLDELITIAFAGRDSVEHKLAEAIASPVKTGLAADED
ncbi:hypothetical protein [Pseudomonas sp. BF-RE-26]|uniref:hypothetical protein n=1 Tax=Pseudomonas sp. BF-RE-26 TaxID=2832396 RepID=UPI001CC1AA10|nr:hypothetical protein [Pseudomonas sp. BF-RE-26]